MTAHQVGTLMLALAIVIVLARALGTLARRLGQPPVVGEIIAGILVGPTFFGTHVSNVVLPKDIAPAMAGLANIGLVLFMFIVGYELDHTLVRGKERVAASVSVGSILLPMGLGVALAFWLAGHHGVTRTVPFALFMGAAMSVTAFPVLARILTDRGMHRIPLGNMALACAAVDDILAWSLLAVVATIGGGGADNWHILFALPFVLVMFLVVRPLLRRVATAHERAGRLTPQILAVVLIGLLLSCYVTEWLGVHVIFGAFLFGVVMPRIGGDALRHEILERIEQVSVLLLLPVFFVLSGVKVDLSKVDYQAVVELALILAVAIVGKFVGAYAGARATGVRSRQAGALAALMNTRGLTELVILTVGLQLGILDQRLYSLMVVMALVTTAMTGPLLTAIYPRKRIERDVEEAQQAALGTPTAHRVLVHLDADGPVDDVVDVGADLARARPGCELVLSRLVAYQTRLEVGTGLSGELLEMTRVMSELDQIAAGYRARGLVVKVHARLSADPASELLAHVAATRPDMVVVAADHPGPAQLRSNPAWRLVAVGEVPAEWNAIGVRLPRGDAEADAVLQTAAALALAHGASITVDTGGRSSRRASAAVEELNRRGLRAGFGTGPVDGLQVATDDAHIMVRAEADAALEEPAEWVAALPEPAALS